MRRRMCKFRYTYLLRAVIVPHPATAQTLPRLKLTAGTAWQHYNNQSYDPVCLYAATKQAYECLIDYYVKVHGLHAVTVKLHDTYGEGDERGKLFYLLQSSRN